MIKFPRHYCRGNLYIISYIANVVTYPKPLFDLLQLSRISKLK